MAIAALSGYAELGNRIEGLTTDELIWIGREYADNLVIDSPVFALIDGLVDRLHATKIQADSKLSDIEREREIVTFWDEGLLPAIEFLVPELNKFFAKHNGRVLGWEKTENE